MIDAIAYAVNVENQGSNLDGDHASGVGTLTVTSVFNFPEVGSLDINGDVYAYTAIDDELNTITLSGVTTADYLDGDRVELSPAYPVWYATVVVGSDQPGFNAMVPIHLVPFLAEDDGGSVFVDGIPVQLEPIAAGEYQWQVVAAPGRQPTYNAGFVDPASTIPPAALTDGDPPASSPTPVAVPFAVGGVAWSVTPVANTDPVRFRVYADTVDPPTVDAAHLVYDGGSHSGSFADIDGVALLPSNPNEAVPPIYVACIEYDADGDAALSATSDPATPRRANVAEISADYIYGGSVEANQVAAGTFVADLAMVGKLSVGNYVDIDGTDSSITIYADEAHTQPLVQLRPEGSIFRGQVIADDVSVLNGLILQGTASHIAPDAGITLDGSIQDPGSAPTLTVTPATAPWPATPVGWAQRGITWDGSNWLRLIRNTSTGQVRVQTINTSGAVTSTTSDFVTPGNYVNSIVKVGSNLFIASLVAEDFGEFSWYVKKYTTTGGTLSASTKMVEGGGFLPCVGTDGTNLLTAFSTTGGTLRVVERSPATLASVGSTLLGDAPSGHFAYVGRGNFDFGADRIVVQAGSTAHVFTLSGTTLTEQTDESFTVPSSTSGGGFTWDGSNFYSNHSAALLYKYNDHYPAASEKIYVAYTDNNGADHTKASPIKSVTTQKRRYIQAALPPAPTGAATPKVYALLATSTPAVTTLKLRAETITSRNTLLNPATAGGTTIGTDSNTFGSGTPGWIKSQVGGLELHGDGTVKINTETFTGDYVAYTPAWTAASSNPSLGNGSIVGLYQELGETIAFRIVLAMGSTTTYGTGAWSFGLPVNGTGNNSPANITARLTGNWMRIGNPDSASSFRLYDTDGTAVDSTTRSWSDGNVVAIHGTYKRA